MTLEVAKVATVWCQPCRTFSRTFNKALEDLRFTPRYIDADESPDLVASWGVSAWPTTVILRDGEPVATLTGAVRLSVLKEFIHEHLEDV